MSECCTKGELAERTWWIVVSPDSHNPQLAQSLLQAEYDHTQSPYESMSPQFLGYTAPCMNHRNNGAFQHSRFLTWVKCTNCRSLWLQEIPSPTLPRPPGGCGRGVVCRGGRGGGGWTWELGSLYVATLGANILESSSSCRQPLRNSSSVRLPSLFSSILLKIFFALSSAVSVGLTAPAPNMS